MMEPKFETCFEDLPNEMLKAILNKLDPEDVVNCRLVSQRMMGIVDEHLDLEHRIWRPYFAKQKIADVLSTFQWKFRGTRFSNAEDVDAFMEQCENLKDPDMNPFLNKTMILYPATATKHYGGLFEKFPGLVQSYGHHVRHCFYFVTGDVPESVMNIPQIFQLKNLVTVTIFCSLWRAAVEYIIDQWQKEPFETPNLKFFKDINFLGDCTTELLKPLFFHYGPQIKRLHSWNSGEAFNTTDIIPNLEELKVRDAPDYVLLNTLKQADWPLKKLSLKISGELFIGDLMDTLKKYAETLESLYLQIDKGNTKFHNDRGGILFPKVTDLRLPLHFCRRGELLVLVNLLRMFPNLGGLQFVDSEDWLDGQVNQETEISNIIQPLWEIVPSGLDVISIRYRSRPLGQQMKNVVRKFRKIMVDSGNATSMSESRAD